MAEVTFGSFIEKGGLKSKGNWFILNNVWNKIKKLMG